MTQVVRAGLYSLLPAEMVRNGQQIFANGSGSNGAEIPRSAATIGVMMGTGGCAACHGPQGHGE